VARVLGISRNTVKKYVNLNAPPVYPPRKMYVETEVNA
jgi:hypothetical protein